MAAPQSTVEYRDIPGSSGYRVGNDGSVWSCRLNGGPGGLTKNWRQIGFDDGYGRKAACIFAEGRWRQRFIHRLVLEAFVGPRPAGLECCHGDGDSLNNRLDNLRWDTHKSNNADTVKHGTQCRGSKSHLARLNEEQVIAIRKKAAEGTPQRLLALLYKVSEATISNIVKRKKWKHVMA